jgi:hypothetical protein
MKPFFLLIIILLSILSCKEKPSDETTDNNDSADSLKVSTTTLPDSSSFLSEFEFYTFNDFQFKSFRGISEKIPVIDVKKYISNRDSIQNLLGVNKLNQLDQPFDSMILQDLIDLTQNNTADTLGEVVFVFNLKNKKIKDGAIIGASDFKNIARINRYPERKGKWSPNKGIDSTIYRTYHSNNVNNSNLNAYSNYKGHPFVSFKKTSLKKVIDGLVSDSLWKVGDKINFYYGYSKDKYDKFHPSVLMTNYSGRLVPTATISTFGFANKGGACCPPQ